MKKKFNKNLIMINLVMHVEFLKNLLTTEKLDIIVTLMGNLEVQLNGVVTSVFN